MEVASRSLPPELLRPIIESADLTAADLCSIALSSRVLREEAQRMLFLDPGTITICLGPEERRMQSFFEAILSSPHRLALLVHTYSQTIDWTDRGGTTHRNSFHIVLKRMGKVLHSMVNLKVLRSSYMGSTESLSSTPIRTTLIDYLEVCTFRLEEFSWNHEFPEIRLLEGFLRSQDGIHTLSTSQGFDITYADTYTDRLLRAGIEACPNLRSINGPTSASRVLLPGKQKVVFVSWRWGLYITEDLDNVSAHAIHVRDGLGTVKYLEYESSHGAGFPFRDISSSLTSLVILKLSNEVLKEVSKLTHTLPALQIIHFLEETNGYFRPFEFSEADTFEDLPPVSAIFSTQANLRCVDIDRSLYIKSVWEPDFKRYMRSPETGLVMWRSVDTSRVDEDWWKNREDLLEKVCDGRYFEDESLAVWNY